MQQAKCGQEGDEDTSEVNIAAAPTLCVSHGQSERGPSRRGRYQEQPQKGCESRMKRARHRVNSEDGSVVSDEVLFWSRLRGVSHSDV